MEIFTVNISIISETMSEPRVIREVLGLYVGRDLLPQITDYAAITDIKFEVINSVDMAIWQVPRWYPKGEDEMRKRLVRESVRLGMEEGEDIPYFNFYYYDDEPHILSVVPNKPTANWKQLLIYARDTLKKYGYDSAHFVIIIDPEDGNFIVRDAITLIMSLEDMPTFRLISSPIPGSDKNILIISPGF